MGRGLGAALLRVDRLPRAGDQVVVDAVLVVAGVAPRRRRPVGAFELSPAGRVAVVVDEQELAAGLGAEEVAAALDVEPWTLLQR